MGQNRVERKMSAEHVYFSPLWMQLTLRGRRPILLVFLGNDFV